MKQAVFKSTPGTVSVPLCVYDVNDDYRVVYANPALIDHLDLSAGDILGQTPEFWGTTPDIGFLLRKPDNYPDVTTLDILITHHLSSGGLITVDMVFHHISIGGNDYIIHELWPATITTGQIQKPQSLAAPAGGELAVQETPQQLEHFARVAPGFMCTVLITASQQSRFTYISPAAEEVLGVAPSLFMDNAANFLDIVHPNDAVRMVQIATENIQKLQPYVVEYRIQHPIKGERWIESKSVPVLNENQEIELHGIISDVTDRKHLEKSVLLSERKFRNLVENSPDAFIRYDLSGRIVYVNPRLLELLECSEDTLLGKTPYDFPNPGDDKPFVEKFHRVLSKRQIERLSTTLRKASGQEVVLDFRLTPELDENDRIVSVLAVGRDVTELEQYQRQIHQLAFYDGLTGLPNRALFQDRLQHALTEADWREQQTGLMFIDLDRFKEVNDTLGHSIGDQLIAAVAKRIATAIREYDTLARLGGDEFAILLPWLHDSSDAVSIARKILTGLTLPFVIEGRELFISASIGIAIYPDDGQEVDLLVRHADSAMYHAKNQGRNNFQFYSTELTARSSHRMEIESSLRNALVQEEFQLYYQPQIDIVNNTLVGAEALLRWCPNGSKSIITPGSFIGIAEDTGLIIPIGEWVLREACRQLVRWNTGERQTPLKISVNVSTRQFILNDLAKTVLSVIEDTGCKPEWLKLEITESVLLEDSQAVTEIMTKLSRSGIDFSIDDFGTGYSALSYLNRFPVKQIKIDKSFISGINNSEEKAGLVKAMISIADTLKLELVAEGVELIEQAEFLQQNGCRYVQGFLYGKPMQRQAFEQLILPTL